MHLVRKLDVTGERVPMFKTTIGFALTIALSSISYGAKLASFCYAKDAEVLEIQGTNIDKLLPIASVSKVVTSYWGIAEKTSNYRFTTGAAVTRISKDTFDVHIIGSRDPYFGHESLHFLISELNKKGITKVRNLTFDENFKFYWELRKNTDSASPVSGFELADDPGPINVKRQLTLYKSLLSGYTKTVAYAKSFNIAMIENPVFSVENIEYMKSTDFQQTLGTVVYQVRSAPLYTLLKEMNRNSNNHAAEQIFAHLGGTEKFAKFIKSDMGFTNKEIHFVNGSGNNISKDDGIYNEATCEAMLKIIKKLRTKIKTEGRNFGDLLSIAGINQDSTVDNIYNTSETNRALIAKTGTVGPNVTLAGLINTQDGIVYFMYNQSTKSSQADWSAARSNIRIALYNLVKQFNGGKPLAFNDVKFLSFDKESGIIDEASKGLGLSLP